ncbi:MAG: FIST C-terminal domain-containing protein [Betaproteobacteria bacterium]|nr:FIST C-terminal domain-containing protein [Betaproteobacteria bacterium]
MPSVEVRFGKSFNPDVQTAVHELAAQTSSIEPDFLIFFCSPKYDLPALGKAIKTTFDCPAIGCTTAGEILASEGYIEDAIVCVAIASEKLRPKLFFIEDLRAFANEIGPVEELSGADRKRGFALFLIDGLSMLEEPVVARVSQTLKGIPVIGASAGDNLAFEHTYVYHDGAFHENAAVLAIVETTLPFLPLHIQHFEPTDKRIVITAADPLTRTVTEINGLPAVEEYARVLDKNVDELTTLVFTAHPLMLKVGGKYYVRTVQKANSDGSLTFFCAIDSGIVLTLAKPSGSATVNLEDNLERIRKTIPDPILIFGSDCINRRLEMQRHSELEEAKRILSRYPFIGFSTYGEQFYGVHVNYTLTALVLGDEA